MALFCNGCGERRLGKDNCTKRCAEKYGVMVGVTRVPPLDGYVWTEAEGAVSDEEARLAREEYFAEKRRRHELG